MSRCLSRSLMILLLFSVTGKAHAQIPEWGDKDLVVRAGLQLWLDASRVNVFLKAQNKPEPGSGDAIMSWPDGATVLRSVEQKEEKSRPKLVRVGDSWVMRFDGEDDHFRLTGTNIKLQAATVFIVVAPHSNPESRRSAGNYIEN